MIFFRLFKCPDQDIKFLENRILLYRYNPLFDQMLIPLKPKDILLQDAIVEVLISRKLKRKNASPLCNISFRKRVSLPTRK